MTRIKYYYNVFFRPRGIYSFLRKHITKNSFILDVGCGNDSSYRIKSLFPFINYTGVDIGDYNLKSPNLSDRYLIFSPITFSNEIASLSPDFDIVLSSHNLEHCNSPYETLGSMLDVLKSGGYMYLAFPCFESVNFPSRKVTLNYYDDSTHTSTPLDFNRVIQIIGVKNAEVIYFSKKYRPFFLWLIGLFQEPFSRLLRRNLQGTWAFYGFETIIWVRKL
jgi:SAM-dependent methyltransferase